MWEDNRWEPPLVDDDWHALCHAINMGEGVEWENLYYKFVEMTKESNIRRETQQGKHALECEGCQGKRRRGILPGQRAEHRRSGRGLAGVVDQAQSPVMAMTEALRRVGGS